MLQGLWLDLRSAARGLARYPSATGVAIVSLGLGLGGATALFSVLDAVLLRSLPFSEPDRVFAISERSREGASNTSFATATDLRSMARSLSDVAVVGGWSPTLAGAEGIDPEQLNGQKVSANYFRVLGSALLLGRDFEASEDHANQPRVAVLGNGLWVRRFGGDPGIVGRTISLSGRPHTVIGVLKPGVDRAIVREGSRDIFALLGYEATDAWACRTCRHLRAIGRVAPGVSIAEVRAELEVIGQSLVRQHPKDYATAGFVLDPFQTWLASRAKPWLIAVSAAAFVLLLLAAVNVGHLELARAIEGQSTLAVRSALGARPLDLARHALSRSAILAAAGLSLGLLLARVLIPLLVAMAPAGTARIDNVSLDLRVLGAGVVFTLVAALLFGSLAMWRSSRTSPGDALKDGARGTRSRGHSRILGGLIAAEIALGLTLAFGASLVGRSLERLLEVDPGVKVESILTAEVSLPGARYETTEKISAFHSRLIEELRSQPGVVSAGSVSQLPLGGNMDGWGVHIEGKLAANPEEDPSADRFAVTAGYIETMGIKLVRGRSIEPADTGSSPRVALINETLARSQFAGEDPIGRRFRVGGPEEPWREIVGVVSDVRHQGLDQVPANQFYVPHAQFGDSAMVLVVGYEGSAALAASTLRTVVRNLDKGLPVSSVQTMSDVVKRASADRRFAALLMSAFGGLALILLATGVFSVLTFVLASRRRDFAVRKALGASAAALLQAIAGKFGPPVLLGLAASVPLASWTGRRLEALLFAVTPSDGPSALFALLAVGLAIVAALGLPLRRAIRVEASSVLRDE